jgi:hypothetical protein
MNQEPRQDDLQWRIVERWQEYGGEARANLLRLLTIATFYCIELINYHGLDFGPLHFPKEVDHDFHRIVTALSLSWSMMGALVLLCLRRGVFPGGLKFVTSGVDLSFLTFILLVADGVRSPLVVGYFLVIALAAVRFSVGLVQFTTAGSLAGVAFLVGHARMHNLPRPPHYHILILGAALLFLGIILGQVVRKVRHLAIEYAQRSAQEAKA